MGLTKVKINLGTEGNLSGSRSIIQSTKTLVSSSAQLATDISGSITSVSSSTATRVAANLASINTLNGSGAAQGVGTSDSPTFNDVTVTGTLTAQEIHTEFESASVIFTSGSTIFGNSSDDVHKMTGSLKIVSDITSDTALNGLVIDLSKDTSSANSNQIITGADIGVDVIAIKDIHAAIKGVNVNVSASLTDVGSHTNSLYGIDLNVTPYASSNETVYGVKINVDDNTTSATDYGLHVTAANNYLSGNLGIGTASPSNIFHSHGVTHRFSSDSYNVVYIQADANNDGSNDDIVLQFTTGNSNTVKGELRYDESDDKFEISAGDNQNHLVISSSGEATFSDDVQAGKFKAYTTSTTDPVLILGDQGVADYNWTFPDTSTIKLSTNTSSSKTFLLQNDGSGEFNFQIDGTLTIPEYLDIDQAAQNGIRIKTDDTAVIWVYDKTADSITGGINFAHADGTILFYTNGTTERMRIDSLGNVGIGASGSNLNSRIVRGFSANKGLVIETAQPAIQFVDTADTDKYYTQAYDNGTMYFYNDAAGDVIFYTNGGQKFTIQSDQATILTVRSYLAGTSQPTQSIRFQGHHAGLGDGLRTFSQIQSRKSNATGGSVAGELRFFTNETDNSLNEWMRIDYEGKIYMYNVYGRAVGSTKRAVYIGDGGDLGYDSSVREHKMDITSLSDVSWLDNLNPVSFYRRNQNEDGTYGNERNGDIEYGLIADEVESVNSDFVFYDEDEDGNQSLAGVEYNQLMIPMLKKIQQLEERISELES